MVLADRARGAGVAAASTATTVTLLALVAQTAYTSLRDVERSPADRGLGLALLAVVTVGFVRLRLSHARDRFERWAPVIAAVVAIATLAQILLYQGWAVAGIGGAALLLALTGPVAVAALATYIALTFALVAWASPQGVGGALVTTGLALLSGSVLFSTSALTSALITVERTRAELVRRNVDSERERISRHLHDALGRTLATIALRTEIASQTAEQPDRVRAELGSIREAVVAGQGELRRMTAVPLSVGLAEEVAASSAVLRRLGVRVTVSTTEVDDPQLDLLAASVVREGVTNALRHARPATCWIAVREVDGDLLVVVMNDGCTGSAQTAGGTGLGYVRALVEGLGGRVQAGPLPSDARRFRLEMRVPLVRTGELEREDAV